MIEYLNCINNRGRESTLIEKNKVYPKNTVICTIPEDKTEDAKLINSLKTKLNKEIEIYNLNFLCKYKIGDGEHTWTELEYQPGLIPLIIIHPSFTERFQEQLRNYKEDAE